MRRLHHLKIGTAIALLAGPWLVASASAQIVRGGGAVGTNPTVSTLTTGTILDASASISADGRYITMGLHPSFSALQGIDTFTSGGLLPNGQQPAFGLRQIPPRPAGVGNVTFVEKDKALLAVIVPATKIDNLTLHDAVKKLAAVSKANLAVGYRGLEQAQVDAKAPLTLNMPEQPMKQAILQLMTAAAPNLSLVITAEDNVISVATQGQADNDVISKIYLLDDLVAAAPRFMSASPAATSTPPQKSSPVMVNGKEVPLKDLAPAPNPSPSTTIVELITANVRPEIWKINGGKIGEISQSGDRVWIKAPASVHALLEPLTKKNPNAAPMYIGYGSH